MTDETADDLLEDLVASALEALDRGGDEALLAFLAQHPDHREQVLAVVTPFRKSGMLVGAAPRDFPERLGEFRLKDRIGSGGMGVVFLAEQEPLDRTVALKVIRPDLLFFAGARERFRREIEVIAKMQHPAIVPILASGEHDGLPWYAMQHIVGGSIDAVCKRLAGREPTGLTGADLARALREDTVSSAALDSSAFAGSWWEACARLARQAALGLEHAHQHGIVHRDVKPSNVMLTPDGRALLVDFGLAMVETDQKLTRTGTEPGSPAYMAPEQVLGTAADARSDVYSLAATLFELLELKQPFRTDNAENLRARILTGQRTPFQNRDVPRELRLVITAAMDLDPARRHQSAQAFADDLAAVLARRPIAARRLPMRLRLLRWAQRHRTTAAALAILALGAATVPGFVAWRQARLIQDLADEKVKAEQGLDRALAAIRQFLIGFGASDASSMPGGLSPATDMLDQAMQMLRDLPTSTTAPIAQYRAYTGRLLVRSLIQSNQVEKACAIAAQIIADTPAEVAATPRIALVLAGVREELIDLQVHGMAIPGVDELCVAAHHDLDLALGDPALLETAHGLRAQIFGHQAQMLRASGDQKGGIAKMRAALAEIAPYEVGPRGEWSTAHMLRNQLADMLWNEGQLDEASALFERVIQGLTPALDRTAGDPREIRLRAYAEWGLGHVAIVAERFQDAARRLRTAAELYEASLFAYPDDVDQRTVFACVLTELPQVERQISGGTIDTAMLERARRLFMSVHKALARDSRGRAAEHTNLQLLYKAYATGKQAAELAVLARETANLMVDAKELATAGWHSLLAADIAEHQGDQALVRTCADDAMNALLACDRAGWFPPIDLTEPPCRFLAERPEFQDLLGRHPAPGSTRNRSASRDKPR